MKRRYQIDQQRAVQQFRQLAREENPSIQMIFPMAEVVGLLQEGVGHLLREAGLLMNLVMEEEVRHLAGERHQQHTKRRAHRWGKEDGYCVVDGQKVPIRRTRLRSPEYREQRLGRHGRNAHRASFARAPRNCAHPGEHQCDRVGLLHRRDGLPQRKTMACRRSHRALGRLWFAGGRAPVSQGAGLPGDSIAVDFACQRGKKTVVEQGKERLRNL